MSIKLCVSCDQNVEEHELQVDFIVPLYRSSEHIRDLFERVNTLQSDFHVPVQLILVLDGPDSATESSIREHKDFLTCSLRTIVLSRNFGVGPALLAGLSESDSCVSMCFGSDLQEPEFLFNKFLEIIWLNNADIALGNRISREDPVLSKIGAAFFWFIYRKFINHEVPKGGFDVFALNRKARTALTSLTELNTSITSQIGWIGFRQIYVPFNREIRKTGKSTWTLRRKMKLFSDSIFGFTFLPITAITMIGFFLTAVFLIISIAISVMVLFGWMRVEGYATLALLIGVGNSATIFCIGLLGGYISRTFDNSKRRPTFIVLRKY